MIARAVACAVVLGASAAAAAPVVVAGVPVELGVAGWTVVGGDALRGPASEIRVAKLAGWCGQWAGALATPAWAPTTFWPSARASPGGAAVCLQRRDDAWIVTIGGVPAGGEPDADTRAVLLAVADALRPPVELPNPGGAALRVRLPVPVTAIAGGSKYGGFDGVESFELSLWIQEGACDIGGHLVADDETPPPWLAAHEDLDDRQLLCAELADRAVGLKWPLSELPLRGPMMRALAAPALAALGAPVTNAGGELPILGKPTHLDPRTAGRWKAIAQDGVTTLTSLDADVPFVITVLAREDCPAGDRMPEERSQGFAPPALMPVRLGKPASSATTLRLAMCLQLGARAPVIEIGGLSPAGEPPSGQAAVKVRAALVAAASGFGIDPEAAPGGRATRELPPPRQTAAHYRTDLAFWGGVISLAPADAGTDRGVLAGADVRASPKYGFGLAANLSGEIGYTSGVEEQVRGGIGAGFGLGIVSIQVTAGASVGSVGNGGTISAYGQAGALLDLQSVILSAAALHSFAEYGDDETRYDARIAVSPGASRSTFVGGVQLIEFGQAGGSAFVAYVGFGVTSGHEPPPVGE